MHIPESRLPDAAEIVLADGRLIHRGFSRRDRRLIG
jgi:hypothetical protein